jgi:hypothetical protein
MRTVNQFLTPALPARREHYVRPVHWSAKRMGSSIHSASHFDAATRPTIGRAASAYTPAQDGSPTTGRGEGRRMQDRIAWRSPAEEGGWHRNRYRPPGTRHRSIPTRYWTGRGALCLRADTERAMTTPRQAGGGCACRMRLRWPGQGSPAGPVDNRGARSSR